MSAITKNYLEPHAACSGAPLGLDDFLKQYRISERALKNSYLYLGQGDREIGALKFTEYTEKGLIKIEKVGFDKHGQDKFYIMIHERLRTGAWNQFHIGISRKGALRGVLRPLSEDRIDSKCLENARQLRRALGKKYRGPISRLMNDENGVKVTELGGENLWDLARQCKLSRQERLTLYKSLFEGIRELHSHGYVHTDLKLENVVVDRDKEGNISGVKIIDLDRLKKINEGHETKKVFYFAYSPERILGKDDGLANPKDDIWAAMCLICDLEIQMNEEERFLNPQAISRYIQYQENLKAGIGLEEICLKKSLFTGTRPDTFFDNLVFHMGMTNPQLRPSAEKILSLLSALV